MSKKTLDASINTNFPVNIDSYLQELSIHLSEYTRINATLYIWESEGSIIQIDIFLNTETKTIKVELFEKDYITDMEWTTWAFDEWQMDLKDSAIDAHRINFAMEIILKRYLRNGE